MKETCSHYRIHAKITPVQLEDFFIENDPIIGKKFKH